LRDSCCNVFFSAGQFNGTFHGQAGDQNGMASQTRHSEIRLLQLRQPMIDDMRMRKLTPGTQHDAAH
jgi:hypothetical protein